jgi:hypothetical protein
MSLTGSGCIKHRDRERLREMRGRSVEQAFDSHRDRFLSIPGVIGAGIVRFDERPCIVVMVRYRTPDIETLVPPELDGYPVVTEIVEDGAAMDSLEVNFSR